MSYLEGCTAPQRDTNQLHAAVVELIALDNASVKYSTVQNWYAGDAEGKGGIFNFVTKRGKCAGVNSKISWTQVETGSAITWKYPSVILQGDNSTGEFYSVAVVNNHQQADTGTKMIHIGKNTKSHDRLEGNLSRPRQQQLSRAGEGSSAGDGSEELHAVRFDADRKRVRCAHVPVHRGAEQHCDARARGVDVEDRGGSDLLLQAARTERRARGVDDRLADFVGRCFRTCRWSSRSRLSSCLGSLSKDRSDRSRVRVGMSARLRLPRAQSTEQMGTAPFESECSCSCVSMDYRRSSPGTARKRAAGRTGQRNSNN